MTPSKDLKIVNVPEKRKEGSMNTLKNVTENSTENRKENTAMKELKKVTENRVSSRKENTAMNTRKKTAEKSVKCEESYRILAKDVMVSNDMEKTKKNNHDLIVGGSCAGKTGGYVTPNILLADSSMVIVDTKGLLYNRYCKYLKKKGFRVENIDFVNPSQSCIYNPLDFVRKTTDKDGNVIYRQQDLKTIANVLIPDNLDKEEKFWVTSARNVLISLMAYVIEEMEPSECNMCTVARLYLMMGNSGKSHDGFFELLRSEKPNSFAVAMYDTYKDTYLSEKTWSCIKQFVSLGLDPFIYDDLKVMFDGKSTLDFADIGRKKTVLFVNISDVDRSMDQVVDVFYQQMFQRLVQEADGRPEKILPIPVRIIMDDFAANFNIPNFDGLISVIRSRHIFVSLILQSLSQLEGIYTPAEAKTIINNCDFKVFIGSQDPDTARYIGDMAGCVPEKISNQMKADDVCVIIKGEEAKFTKAIPPYSMDIEMGV